MIEEISAKVHDAWMDGKRAKGIESRKSESGEELMVPYEQLSEEAKDMDRATVKAVMDGIRAAGMVISRATSGVSTDGGL